MERGQDFKLVRAFSSIFFVEAVSIVRYVNSSKKSLVNDVYTDLALTSFKNSNGEAKQTIYPRIIYKAQDLPADRVKVDWTMADAKLLSGPDIPRSKLASEGVIDVKESSKPGLFNDAVTGLKMVPITEITDALYADEERLSKFRKILAITKNKTIDELYEDGWFAGAKAGVKLGEDE